MSCDYLFTLNQFGCLTLIVSLSGCTPSESLFPGFLGEVEALRVGCRGVNVIFLL